MHQAEKNDSNECMGDIISLLQYVGITPDRFVPLLIMAGLILSVVHKFIAPIKKSVSRLTNAVIEIQTTLENLDQEVRYYREQKEISPVE